MLGRGDNNSQRSEEVTQPTGGEHKFCIGLIHVYAVHSDEKLGRISNSCRLLMSYIN
jgi:hypothetical protein